MQEVLQYIANGLMIGGVYALVALGIVLIYKATGIFNFAIGQMMMFGAFIVWTFLEPIGLPIWAGITLALVCGAVLGLMIERLCLRPLIGQSLLSSMMITLALSNVMMGLAMAAWGPMPQVLKEVFPGSISAGGIAFPKDLLWAFASSMVVFVLVALFYQRTRVGLAMRAVAESHQVAQSKGINVGNMFALTWLLCGVVTVVGGLFIAYKMSVSQFIAQVGLKAFAVVLFGGLESIPGALIGGLVVGVIENLAGGLIASWLLETAPFIVLLLVLIIRPEGLFGLKRIERI